MKKNTSNGFMLVETLVVTIFVSLILIFLLVQFTNLNKNYEKYSKYNVVGDLYNLNDIINFINSDPVVLEYIENNVSYNQYIDITDCNIFDEKEYCIQLFDLLKIKKVIISTNKINNNIFENFNNDFKKFISRIKKSGNEKFRIIAYFNNSTYATVRFGDNNE